MISKSKSSSSLAQKLSKPPSNQQQNPNIIQGEQLNQVYSQNIYLSQQIQKLAVENTKLKKQVTGLKLIISKHKTDTESGKESVLKSQLESLTKFHAKTKKELETVTKSYQQLIKQNNEFKSRIINSEKQIGLLKTVKSTKRILSDKEFKDPKEGKRDNQERVNQGNSKSKGKAVSEVKNGLVEIRVVQEEKRALEKRIELYEKERKSAQSVFQPIIQQTNQQLKALIQQKNTLLTSNAELSRNLGMLEVQILDLKEKNVRLIQILNKQRKDDEQRNKGKEEEGKGLANTQVEGYEQRIRELTGLYQNSLSQIKSLEEVGKYLSAQNRKLLLKH